MSARDLSGSLGMFQERTKAFKLLSGLSLRRGGSYFRNLGGKTGSGKPKIIFVRANFSLAISGEI